MNDAISDRWAPLALSILRIVTALLFLLHGTAKMFGFPTAMGAFDPFSLMGVAAVLEVVGGILLLLGLFTRPVAFILCGEMAVAYFMAHAPQSLYPISNGGEGAILFCFIFLYLFVEGAGSLSLDAMRRRTA